VIFGLGLAVLALGPAHAAERAPIVVELFTSQGCSSCPPANDNLRSLADRPDVLALSFSVTYWDSLGWKDTFGREEYTRRQYAYSHALGYKNPFTPEMVINGRKYVVGNKREEIDWTLQRVPRADGPALSLSGAALNIPAADRRHQPPADVWLVRYDPHTVNVPVGRGENAGVTLPHRNVVHALTRLGGWDGSAETFTLPPSSNGLSTAILLQEPGGAILSAVKL
jgi:hypothetical protein